MWTDVTEFKLQMLSSFVVVFVFWKNYTIVGVVVHAPNPSTEVATTERLVDPILG